MLKIFFLFSDFPSRPLKVEEVRSFQNFKWSNYNKTQTESIEYSEDESSKYIDQEYLKDPRSICIRSICERYSSMNHSSKASRSILILLEIPTSRKHQAKGSAAQIHINRSLKCHSRRSEERLPARGQTPWWRSRCRPGGSAATRSPPATSSKLELS